jgi:dolichol-phosphate mannosyltransferase
VLLRFPWLLVRGLARRFFWRYMIRDFNVLTLSVLAGIPALAFGITFGAYHWWLSLTTGVPATAGTTILAALPIIVGFQCMLTALVLDVLYQPVRPLITRSHGSSSEGPGAIARFQAAASVSEATIASET